MNRSLVCALLVLLPFCHAGVMMMTADSGSLQCTDTFPDNSFASFMPLDTCLKQGNQYITITCASTSDDTVDISSNVFADSTCKRQTASNPARMANHNKCNQMGQGLYYVDCANKAVLPAFMRSMSLIAMNTLTTTCPSGSLLESSMTNLIKASNHANCSKRVSIPILTDAYNLVFSSSGDATFKVCSLNQTILLPYTASCGSDMGRQFPFVYQSLVPSMSPGSDSGMSTGTIVAICIALIAALGGAYAFFFTSICLGARRTVMTDCCGQKESALLGDDSGFTSLNQ
jgi:hypothetical protein